ncbi:MAG: peptidylprolyl isomerase [Polyangiales bacterium]
MSSPPESRSEKRAPRLASRLLAAPTLHFFVVGFVVLVSERAWTRAHTERPTLHVVVPTGLGPAEREKRVDAAVLIEEGLGLGWARTDHVIRTRLITNLRFARGETRPGDEDATSPAVPRDDDAALLEEALRLGMERSDLIVRRRIVSRAERMMTSDVRHAPVDDGTLLAFRDAHPERFRAPARFRYVDVFLSQQRRGDTLDHAVSATQAQLTRSGLAPEQAASLSDPLLYSPGDRWVSADEVARRLGGDLATQLEAAPLRRWAGPFRSSFGVHFVWVRERREAALPSLEEARARILGAYRDDRQAEAMRRRMAELRAHYDITVEEREGAP